MTAALLTFQDAIARLQAYWASQGCAIWLPHNVEVGAGTYNPGTFLHVLGPEPWNVVYVEPSIRPDDARYGENPNRFGRHHQLQVILKPDPGDPQELYLASLGAIGVDLRRHDIRFVEDNWESPALGAWGLGWEVWLDGLEITQFTYFQQAGSLNLDPVAVEITYGIERILMALQDVAHFRDLAWNEHLRFGDVVLGYEVQTSRYYFEEANVERLRQMFDLSEAEAETALALGLVRPGHDYVLKCSHLFNVLDARGAVGVSERARFFQRMRALSRRVAEGYLQERSELGFPLLAPRDGRPWVAGAGDETAPDRRPSAGAPTAGASTAPGTVAGATAPPDAPADFVLEVGVEELPVADQDAALQALSDRFPALLGELRLDHGGVSVSGTPRRLAVIVGGLAPRQTDIATQVVGPPAAAAFDSDGRPTRAAEGFARSAGVEVADLEIVERGGERRVAALKRSTGRAASEVLCESVPALLAALPFGRSMRWNASGQAFSRPVRWLVALHGRWVVPVAFAGLVADRVTRGLRPRGTPRLPIAAAEDYRKVLRTHAIELDPERRRAAVWRQVTDATAPTGGTVPADDGLVAEVAGLVEAPYALLGAFDARFLELPAPVLVTVLRKHQRCFPVERAPGSLLPHFVAVANGDGIDPDTVRHGNEAVVRARFADAAYFWRQDLAHPLAEYTPRLARLTFQADLGSVLDKVRRLERLVPALAARLGLSEADAAHARRAAELAKSDLVTSMVVDFTSLQGVMGAEYARRGGEPEAVAAAIGEQYLPRGAGDDLPVSGPGIALALADRLDSLVGLFAAGLKPSGANDPYALRRAALGVATILVERSLALDLSAAIDDAAGSCPLPLTAETRADLLDFLRRRLEGQLRDQGHAADAVSAVLAVQGADPYAAARDVAVLERHVARDTWADSLTAYARCARIVRAAGGAAAAEVDPDRLTEAAERELYGALESVSGDLDRRDADAVLSALVVLAPTIHRFFDAVLVMADDPPLRANRLALVGRVAALPAMVADLSLLASF
jgi:glycyl-tRNA synthetase